jgi:hypothetical protein
VQGNSSPQNNEPNGRPHKKATIESGLVGHGPFAWGQLSETTTTVDANGTITEFTPGSTIVLKETSGPVNCGFGKTVVYTTRSGTVLSDADVRTKVRVGVPVRVHFAGEGDARVVDRIILDED